MKKLNKYLRILTMIVFLFAVFLHATGQENKGTIKVTNNSCGAEVLQYLKNNYYNTPPCNYTLPQKKELSLAEMLTACKTFKTEAQAVKCQLKDLKALAKPIILHLKTNHYILLLGNEDNQFEIYDPAAEHLKKVGQSYMEYFFSNQAIVFSDKHNCKFISKYELINSSGTYAHEYPPPNESDDFYLGLMKYLKPKGECSINRSKGGSPLMSFNPLNLNIVVEDMPMWYDPGIGPFIQLGLVYNSNDQQQISGGLLVPTQYFPFGKRWSFYYASFYHEQSPDIITLIMTDGAKVTFTFSENTSIPNHGNFHNKFERYPVTGGYGYCLTMKKSKMKFIYDNPIHDKLTSIVDQNGNVVVLNYNTDFNLVSITDANGRPLNFTLNDDGRIIQATDPLGRTATFEYGYTNDEFLVGITDMGGFESTIEYDEVPILAQLGSVIESQITSITTPTGTSEIAYAPTNNIGPWLLAFTWIFTNPAGVSSIAQYSWGGYFDGITKVYDNNGNFTEYFSNLQKSQFTHIVPPDPSATVYYRYDEQGKIINITNGIFETKYIYDDNGNIIQVIDPRNKITDLSYDLNDNLKAITDPMNRTISFDYDQNNNPVSITTSVNQQFFSYYSDGNLKDVTDANGNVTSMEYDAMGYLIQIDFPISSPYSYINDDVGRTTSVTINGVTYQYTYDYLDQTTQVSFPDATQVNMTYDFRNLVGITDRAGRHTSLAYDKMNQVIGVKNPLGLISLNRDPNGNVQILTINEQANYFVYDKMDRLITETNPDLSSKYYTYNELGNVFTRIDEKGLLTTYSYDYNLLVNIDYPDNTADVSFAYNDNGEIIEMTDGIGTKNYEYDSFGRLIGVSTTGGAGNFNYTLDSVGNRKTMVTDGLAVFYTYDKLNRLKHIESNHASADYLYDVNNNMSKITYGNGTYTEYAYNELNLPVSLYHKKSNNEIFSGFNYTYDQASLIKKIEDQQGNTSNYTYDYAYQLIEEQVLDNAGKTMWHNKFEYDNMGNRLTINANGTTDLYTYNSSNQLTSMTQTTINVNGVVYGDSATSVYVEDIKANTTYLGNNQLLFEARNIPLNQDKDTLLLYARVNGVLAIVGDSSKFISEVQTQPDGQVNVFLFTDVENVAPENINTIYLKKNLIQYTYDPNGNHIQKIFPPDTTQYTYDAENRLIRIDLPGGNYEEYVYDGFGQRIKTLKNGILYKSYVYDNLFEAIAITNSDNNTQHITRGLNYGGGIGGIFGRYDESNENITNHFNHRGDLINATNDDEEIVASFNYDAFGKIQSASQLQNIDFTFSSKEFNTATGLHYFGGRYYSTLENRWITKDPLGFEGGFNQYGFVSNNPINFIDPFGYVDVPAGVKEGFQIIWEAIKDKGPDISQEVIVNTIENMAKSGKIRPDFMSRVSGFARAGGAITGLGLTFLSPEGVEAMKGLIDLFIALKYEQALLEEMGYCFVLRPGMEEMQRKIKKYFPNVLLMTREEVFEWANDKWKKYKPW